MIKKIFLNFRVMLLVIVILLSIIAIHPSPGNEGASIRNVAKNSIAYDAGVKSPEPTQTPISKEKIISINNIDVKNANDYYNILSGLSSNQTISLRTDKGAYYLTTAPLYNEEGEIVGISDLGIRVTDAPKSNVRKGLDLEGGTRVLLKPEQKLSPEDMSTLISNMKERLNVYGLSDLIIREVTDRPGIVGEGEQYILVEIAGATQEEVKDLISKQGKFEAKIGNKTVFSGGDDIKDVCRRAECSGIDTRQGCGASGDGRQTCRFQFSITISKEAAGKQASLTENLQVVYSGNEGYLNESLDLYLDDTLVDSLQISQGLKGKEATDISISGSGVGASRPEAEQDALNNMKKLQTVLITGSLPVKLEIVKIDTLSPALGEGFVKNLLFVGLLAILAVGLVIFVRYRKLKISIPIALTMVAEILILVGIAALIGWNLDLAAIAGILVAAGTGVDDQIVITDETLSGENSSLASWKDRLKKAFFIIMAAYILTVVAMFPLLFAGAGLLKGFALTTILGVTVGVFITRPAYASISEILLNK